MGTLIKTVLEQADDPITIGSRHISISGYPGLSAWSEFAPWVNKNHTIEYLSPGDLWFSEVETDIVRAYLPVKRQIRYYQDIAQWKFQIRFYNLGFEHIAFSDLVSGNVFDTLQNDQPYLTGEGFSVLYDDAADFDQDGNFIGTKYGRNYYEQMSAGGLPGKDHRRYARKLDGSRIYIRRDHS